MSPQALALVLLASMAGAIVQSTTGFGYGIVVMSVWPYLMPNYPQTVALAGICALTLSSIVTAKGWRKAHFKITIPLLLGYFAACTFAVRLSSVLPAAALTKALGVVLVAISIYFMFFNNKIKIRPTVLNGLIAGCFAGIGAGLFSIGGPFAVIFLLSAIGDDKEVYRSTSILYMLLSGLYSTAVRVFNGLFTAGLMKLYLITILSIALGAYIGNRIFDRINVATLKRLVYLFMAVSGLTLLF